MTNLFEESVKNADESLKNWGGKSLVLSEKRQGRAGRN